ncbi:hypothetical protein Ahy_B10g101988 [Arachis hypogaea]|uniref:Uncharacterized protein n=1 Tax=Arachis hypogaea TaxID=3818 RepID=A0A444X0Y1_ARAHY|nr:hypothetical protein Ahy_B10g101988 [Arachis hypogaea]
MEEASPFFLLEYAISFTKDLWFNMLPVQSWLDAFSAHRHIGDAITIAHGEIRTARYENSLIVELEIAPQEEFTLIERGLTKLWERLAQERIQETPEKTGKIVQDSMLEEDVVPDSSDEVVFKGYNASMLIFDLNKTLEENDIC